jgi:hypothetical protein
MPLTDEKRDHLQSLYAGRRRMFLQQHHPPTYAAMERAGALETHLRQTGEDAASLYETIIDQMNERADAMTSQADRTSYLLSAPQVASEVVNTDIIYTAP